MIVAGSGQSSALSSQINKNLSLDSQYSSGLNHNLNQLYLDYSHYSQTVLNCISRALSSSTFEFQNYLVLLEGSFNVHAIQQQILNKLGSFHTVLGQLLQVVPFVDRVAKVEHNNLQAKHEELKASIARNLVLVPKNLKDSRTQSASSSSNSPVGINNKNPSKLKYTNQQKIVSPKSSRTDSPYRTQKINTFATESSLISETQTLAQQGNVKQALRILNEKYGSSRGADFYFMLGNIYKTAHNYESAITAYTDAIQHNSDSGCYYNNRGNCYLNLDNPKQAYADFKSALELEPNNDIYANNTGNCLLKLGDYLGALHQFNNALANNNSNDAYFNNKAYAEIKLNRPEEALLSFRQAIARNPTNDMYYKNIGNLYFQKKDFEEALEYYQKARELNSSQTEYHLLEGKTYYKLDRIDEAIWALQKATKISNEPVYREYLEALMQQKQSVHYF